MNQRRGYGNVDASRGRTTSHASTSAAPAQASTGNQGSNAAKPGSLLSWAATMAMRASVASASNENRPPVAAPSRPV